MAGTEGSGRRPARSGAGCSAATTPAAGPAARSSSFIVHPNEIKSLATGEAVVISKLGRPTTEDGAGGAATPRRAGSTDRRGRHSPRAPATPGPRPMSAARPRTRTRAAPHPAPRSSGARHPGRKPRPPPPPRASLLAQRHPRAAGDDHHPVVVGVALARGAAAGGHLEVAHPILARALGLADQLVLAHARERRGRRTPAARRPPSRRRRPHPPTTRRDRSEITPTARAPGRRYAARASRGRRRTPRRCCAGG